MKILNNIDLFGTTIKLKIDGNEEYHSLISILSSIIVLLATILFSYFFGLDFIFHKESNVVQSTRNNKNYEFYNLSIDDLFFAWRIESSNSVEINFTNILYPIFGYSSYKGFYYEKIKYEKCKNFNISNNHPNDIKDFYCSDMRNYSIGGGWENDNKIEYFYLMINICEGRECSSKQDFLNLLNEYGGLYFVLYYPTISFVPDKDIPYQISYKKLNVALDAQLITVNRFYIQKYIFEDDNGWIFSSKKTRQLFGISEISNYNFLNLDEVDELPINSYIYTANFYIDSKYSYYKRWFTKAFESLSLINAFYKILFLIFNFFSSICNKFLMFEVIMLKFNEDIEKLNSNRSSFISNDNEIIQNNKMSSNNINNKIESSNLNLNIISNNNNKNIINNFLKYKSFHIPNLNKKREKFTTFNNLMSKFKIASSRKKNNDINYNIETSKNKPSIYKLLCIYICQLFLSKNKKREYTIDDINRKKFRTNFDINIYLTLIKKVDLLSKEIEQNKFQSNNSY